MRKLFIDIAHGPFSTGACCFGRNEWTDNSKFAVFLADAFGRHPEIQTVSACCVNCSPEERLEFANEMGADAIIVLHRGYAHDNGRGEGARIYVPAFAPASVQYEAGAMLNAFCENTGIRYRGVHLSGRDCVYRSLDSAPKSRVFLFETGCIDSMSDNKKLEDNYFEAAFGIADSLIEVWKEGMKFENNVAL